MARGHDQLNCSIRVAAGRCDPRELAAEAIATAERVCDAAIALRRALTSWLAPDLTPIPIPRKDLRRSKNVIETEN